MEEFIDQSLTPLVSSTPVKKEEPLESLKAEQGRGYSPVFSLSSDSQSPTVKSEKERTPFLCISSSSEISPMSPSSVANCIEVSSDSESEFYMPKLSVKRKRLESDVCKPIEYFNDNQNLPIYSKPNTGLEYIDIIKICLGEVDDRLICKDKPVSVRMNSVFVIDLNYVPLKSLYSDDNGVWKTGTPNRSFKVVCECGKVKSVAEASEAESTHLLKRQYGKHKGTFDANKSTFSRIISSIKTVDGNTSSVAIVQYVLKDCSPDDIVVAPHGNSKGKRKFFKTDPEVFTKLEDASDIKPKKLFSQIIKDAGGPLESTSASKEPRNVQQIYNINRKMKRKVVEEKGSDLGQLIAQIKENEFVRDLTICGKSVQYLLYTDQQLNDLQLFCTNASQFSVFSIDATFNVGDFYVTNTCFENYRIVHADGKYRGRYPHALGPCFIHTDLETNSYVHFFSSLIKANPTLKNIKAIGTDGEEALLNACVICFPDALQLICSDHKKNNIESKLNEYGEKESGKAHIVLDIFGRKFGTLYEIGLIDSESSSLFDKKLMDLKATWDYLVPGFHTWFVRYQADTFKRHIIREVCSKALVKGRFSNNRIESIHRKLKDWFEQTDKHSMPVINCKIEDAVKAEIQDFDLSVFSQGSYDLAPQFSYLKKERHEWNAMSQSDRSQAINRFRKSEPNKYLSKPAQTGGDDNNNMTTSVIQGDEVQTEGGRGLGMACHNISLPGIHEDFLEEMWEKADRLCRLENSIVKAPGYEGCFVRHTPDDSLNKPHLVTVIGNHRVNCENCQLYQSMKICAHAIAGANFLGVLRKFIDWRQKQKKIDSAVSDLAFAGAKGGRKKVSKPRRGGRNPVCTDPKESLKATEREPLVHDDTDVNAIFQDIDNFGREPSFELIYLFQTKATICYGCSEKFVRDKEQNRLVIKKFCEREFTQAGMKKKKWQYAYFHLMKNCVQKKFPEFKLADLEVSSQSKDVMPDNLKEKLKASGVRI